MLKKLEFILSGSADQTINADVTSDDQYTEQPIVVFIHGFKGFKDWGAHHLVAGEFAKQGFRFIKFNLSHNGVSTKNLKDITDLEAFASNTISMERKDVNTIINFVNHTYPTAPVCLIGHSRGGGLAILQAALDERINQLITWSSISGFNTLWKPDQEKEWMRNGKIYVENARTKEKMPLNLSLFQDYKAHEQEFNILQAATQIEIPWLILHGDQDVNVNFNVAQALAQAQPAAKLQKIEGANHVFGASHPYTASDLPAHLKEVCDKSIGFLKEIQSA